MGMCPKSLEAADSDLAGASGKPLQSFEKLPE